MQKKKINMVRRNKQSVPYQWNLRDFSQVKKTYRVEFTCIFSYKENVPMDLHAKIS